MSLFGNALAMIGAQAFPNNDKPRGLSLFGNVLVVIGVEAFPNNDRPSLFGNASAPIPTRAFPNNDKPRGLSLFGNALAPILTRAFPNNDKPCGCHYLGTPGTILGPRRSQIMTNHRVVIIWERPGQYWGQGVPK